MKISQSNLRTCIVTRKKYPKNELLRIARLKTGEIYLDTDHKNLGRGCYVFPTQENFQQLKEKRLLNRAFRTQIANEIYDRILNNDL